MKKYYCLIVICGVYLLGLSSSFGGSNDLERVTRLVSEQPIDDLVLNPAPEIEKDSKTGKPFSIVKGIYFRESWDLLFEGKRIHMDPSGVFTIRVPVGKETTTIELVAKGPHKKVQSEKIEIFIPRLKPNAGIPVVLETEQVSPTNSDTETFDTAKIEMESPALQTTERVAIPTNSTGWGFETGLKLKSFSVAPLLAMQNGDTSGNYTVMVAWTPAYYLSSQFGVNLAVGGMVFEKAGGGRFLSTTTNLLAEWNFYDRLSLGVGSGIQYWWTFGGLSTVISGELSYYLDAPIFHSIKLERFFGDFTWLFDSLRTKQARVGFAIGF